MPRISETLDGKTWFQAHIVEQLELSNGGWIMGIGLSEPKHATFCVRRFFERLRIAYTEPFTTELMDVSELWDLNKKKVEEFLYLLVIVWSPRSEVWPR